MGRHNRFSATAPRPSRIRFAVSRAAAITVVLAVILWVGLSIIFNPTQPAEEVLSVAAPTGDPLPLDSAQTEQEPETITVHVVGEVNHPGVYELPTGSRINDAIHAAGGMNARARPELLNLAAPISDGQQIFLPSEADSTASQPPGLSAVGSPAPESVGGLININRADAETLTRLPGIGPALAGRIIDFRESNGPFTSVEELDEVSGIGPVLVSKIKDLVEAS